MTTILVTYATWTGVSRTIGEAIAETLRDPDTAVDVRRSKEVRDISSYDAVIVGASVHLNKVMGETRRFLRRHRKALREMPAAYFVVCTVLVAEDNAENRQTANGYVDQLRQAAPDVEPVDTAIFNGTMLIDTPEYNKLPFFFKWGSQGMLEEIGDQRDWDAIRAWTESLRPALLRA